MENKKSPGLTKAELVGRCVRLQLMIGDNLTAKDYLEKNVLKALKQNQLNDATMLYIELKCINQQRVQLMELLTIAKETVSK